MKEKLRALAEKNRKAKAREEKKAVAKEMAALEAADPKAFAEALESLIKETASSLY